MIESMNILLEELRKHKSLDNDTIDTLRINANKLKVPYAYFLPDISKVIQTLHIYFHFLSIYCLGK